VNTLRGNYSTQNSGFANALTRFDGAVPVNPTLLLGTLPSASTFGQFGTFDTTSFGIGTDADNRTRQLNFVDDLSWNLGKQQVKFGGDYRAIYLDKRPFQNELNFAAQTVQGFLSPPTEGQVFLQAGTANRAKFLTQAFSLYGQETWKITPRLTLTYGVRWELSPAPSARDKTTLAAWRNVNNPAALALAPPGTPLWNTTYGNFAPRAGIAYSLTDKGDFVVRAGGGVFYDLGVGQAVQLANSFPNFALNTVSVSVPLTDAKPFLPSLSSQPPFASVEAYSPDLKLPRSYQWNVALEKSFAGQQAISATYVGQAGRDLLRQEALAQPNPNFSGAFLLWRGDAFSNYDALQLQYRRPLSSRVRALLNYTWSHSLDNASNDVLAGVSNTVISAARDYASSDFDVRQSFSGAITYAIPGISRYKALSLLTKDWSVDTVIVARSGFPFNAFLLFESADPSGTAATRPDLVPGQPVWVSAPTAPGGKRLNVTYNPNTGGVTGGAFAIPSPIRQGTEGRNDIPGFGLTQVDFSIVRKFPITESVHLRFRADAFNLFNHPNFTNPTGFFELGPLNLQSQHMLNVGLGGLNPLFQEGGPRSLQLSLSLSF
jgi:TonB dependent receptor